MPRGKTDGRYTPSRAGTKKDDESGRWLGTYADAITLLMAFFVMLYAMSEIDVEKFQAFVEGLRVPFSNEAADSVSSSLLPPGATLVGEDGQPAVTPPETMAPPQPPAPSTPADVEGAIDLEQLRRVQAQVQDALAEEQLADVATYRYEERGLVVSIASDDVLFATGSTVIGELGRRVVATVADVLRAVPNDVIVEGHTDDVPLQRPGYSNWNLSTDRAVAVLTLLIEDLGLPSTRVGAAGYGEFRPVADNDTPDGRARNRRVDVLIVAEGLDHG